MLTFLSLKNEFANILVNRNIGSRLNDWIYWILADIVSEYDYWWNLKSDTLTTVASTAEYYLNTRAGKISDEMFNETNNTIIYKTDLQKIYREEPTPTETGSPIQWAFVREDEVSATTSAASAVSVTSSNANDTNIILLVRGRVSGIDRYEELTINGTNTVTGSLSFQAGTIESAVLGSAAAGVITVTANSTTIASIPPGNLRVQCPKIRLWYVPGSAVTIRYFYQQKVVKPLRDSDIIDIPDAAFKALRSGVEQIGHINNGDQDFAELARSRYENDKLDLYKWSLRNQKTHEVKDYRPSPPIGFKLPETIAGNITS